MMGRSTWRFYLLVCCSVLLLAGCKVERYLPEGRYLYEDSTLKITAADSVNTNQLRQEANLVLTQQSSPRWRVWWHYRDGFLLRWLGKRIGRAPIFYTPKQSQLALQLLENRATNAGHFYSLASYTTDTLAKRRSMRVNYQLRVGAPYTIDTVMYRLRAPAIAAIVDSMSKKSLLRRGKAYELQNLRGERQRIAAALQQRGFYFFVEQDLEFLADTMGNDRGVQLLLKLKDGLPARNLQAQRIAGINIYENGRPTTGAAMRPDTLSANGLRIYCRDCALRPEILAEAIAYQVGEYYNPIQHSKTIERLAAYDTYRYISLNYDAVEGSDSLIQLRVSLSPKVRHSVSGEIGASFNSGRYLGPEFAFSYTNRNLFHGAERLTVTGEVNYNFFLGTAGESRIPRSSIYGLEVRFDVPRFWLPNRSSLLPDLRQAGTSMAFGGKVEQIQLQLSRFSEEIDNNNFTELAEILENDPSADAPVNLWQFSTDYAYTWRRRPTIQNQLTLLRLRFQEPQVDSEELLSLSRSLGFTQGLSGLGRLDRMRLFGPAFSWTYDSKLRTGRVGKAPPKHQWFTQLQLGLSFNRVLPIDNNRRELDAENSNYLQPKVDLRYYWSFLRQWTLATRVHAGAAIPFTERAIVPYFDLYTVGGPNSLRGFIPRGLGPGVTEPVDINLLGQDGYGNVLFESSLELRYRFFDFVELAAFADAGNVWLYKTETVPTVGDFAWNSFLDELAVDVGVGLRLDFSFFLLRLDLAKPVAIPYEPTTATTADRKPRFVLGFGQAF